MSNVTAYFPNLRGTRLWIAGVCAYVVEQISVLYFVSVRFIARVSVWVFLSEGGKRAQKIRKSVIGKSDYGEDFAPSQGSSYKAAEGAKFHSIKP